MPDFIFKGLFDTGFSVVISVKDFLLCIGFSLFLGLITALCYMYRNRYTKSFAVTLALLPSVVCIVIMMVNGNVGTGVAVAGAFSLVRFRSAPGSAGEICAIFLSMGTGLITGMGYLGFAFLFTIIMCASFVLCSRLDFGENKNASKYKTLNVTIPENLDYSDIFEDIFNEYTFSYELERVKTTNMGSMFRATYNISLRDPKKEKEMIDKMRCRNGNLEISISKQESIISQL